MAKFAYAFCVLVLATSVGMAEPVQPTVVSNALPDVGSSLLRLAGALVVVFAVFFGGVWCFRNWQRLTINRGALSNLRILEVKALGNRQALYLVNCDQRRLLIGSSSAGLTMLCDVDDARTNIPETVSGRGAGTEGFSRELENSLARNS